ncbi:BolA family transcriptional regulator [Paralimibaculum aggregatum]|uniref:BolA family transcriptional regulator n=1 Tax=Paralimibaculum aggregatum TaxID=3036245 RepID=A0ABQ6LLW9_9RHOB|nr:BolA family protein [Limibaculum sp. NKW23]GMG81411.1 BolA family transcriptional regulator [Limibaculum sp. NKW23]
MSVTETIETKLRAAFAPAEMELVDESDRHRGHSGYREGGESHFRLRMVSEAFAGQSRVERQRAVNRVLAEELAERVHALAMSLKAPGE